MNINIEKAIKNKDGLRRPEHMVFLGGILLGILFFMLVYGYPTLDTTNESYIINEGTDLPGFFIAWDGYRYADWSLGIGMFDTLTYPQVQSYALADVVPWLGLLFKILSPVLPDNFQYAGIWGLICYAMQGGLGALLVYKYARKVWVSIFCSIPFIISVPAMSKLFYHHSQGGQWVLMVALVYWVYSADKEKSFKQEVISWALIGLLTVGVNIYAIPMVGMIFVGYAVMRLLQDKSNLLKMICSVVAYLLAAVAFIALLGGFQSEFVQNESYYAEYIDRLYRCGSNLNAFFNPNGVSVFLRSFAWAKDGQGEGFAYLGLGMLIALLAALFLIVYRTINKLSADSPETVDSLEISDIDKKLEIGMAVTFVLSIFASLGPVVSINDRILLEIPYPEFVIRFWCNFRSTGRMIWPAFYLLLVFIYRILYSVRAKNNRIFVSVFLIFCSLVQITDLSKYIMSKHAWFDRYQELNTPIADDAWDYLGEHYDHMVVLPNSLVNRSNERYILAKIAVDHDITLNDYYLSRQNLTDQTDDYKKAFAAGDIAEDTFYVIKWDDLDDFINYNLNWYGIDGYVVGTKEDITDYIYKDELSHNSVTEYQEYKAQPFIWDGLDYSAVFNPVFYYYSYSDEISAEPDDYAAIFDHFIQVGMKEAKRGNETFDPHMYKNNNGDLAAAFGDDWCEYYKHYIVNGVSEGRRVF